MTAGALSVDPLLSLDGPDVSDSAATLLSDLHREVFEAIDQRGWAAQEIRQIFGVPGMHARIFGVSGAPAAFILWQQILDEAEIIAVGVREMYRGHGVARHCLKYLIEELENSAITRIFLEVREDNTKAIQLYRLFDFECTGRRVEYYQTQSGKKIDALIFSLKI